VSHRNQEGDEMPNAVLAVTLAVFAFVVMASWREDE
jgi:hypothetical protein